MMEQEAIAIDESEHLTDRQVQLLILQELRLLNNMLAPFAVKFGKPSLSKRNWSGKQ